MEPKSNGQPAILLPIEAALVLHQNVTSSSLNVTIKQKNPKQVVVDISSCDHLQREEFTSCGVYIVM